MAQNMTTVRRSALAVLLDGLSVQAAVIKALLVRDLQARYGRHNIGYLWVIGEPFLLASVITLLHTLATHGEKTGGIAPFTFILTGYCLFMIFRSATTRADGVLHASETLFYHRMISPLDVMITQAIIDFLAAISALVVLQGIGMALGLSSLPARPIYLIGAVLLLGWSTFALSLLVATYSYRSPLVERLVHPATYFAGPLSGAMFSMSFLPASLRSYMAWNPLMSIFEMARYGQFQAASDKWIYGEYAIAVAVSMTFWGLIEIRRIRREIHVP
ncbi:ABC transporter permease [Novosphingobium sp. KACC 22771]|uniref:ABC transporter permease n=1 Tax=Novosphingobium sp. KACC 22771 TaxID=3025670 RepID=UPI002366C4B6|nr:ABC transporter permease [Novosphingobium sp. KACC 22771]WDF72760.1 ABC transporter permease [Novosphingobium sp. KACC 22771]